MKSLVQVMLPLTFLLFIGGVTSQFTNINCRLQLVSPNYFGQVTYWGFALFQLCCVSEFPGVNPNDNIVIIVANGRDFERIDFRNISFTNPPLYGDFFINGFYAAITGNAASFCNGLASPFGAIIIGDSFYCRQFLPLSYCNGPLFSGIFYRVAVLVYRNGSLVFATPWSDPISLRNPRNFREIDTKPSKNSPSMIAITTILPVLLAILLLLWAIGLILSCCCSSFSTKQCQNDC